MLSRRGLLKTAGSLALAPHFAVAQDNQANGVTFPKSFFWGASTAAYQVEGAANEDGRGPSIWDEFARQPGKVINGDTGDVACDHYHRWPEDVALMKEAGFSAYRFSVAWPRVLPDGSNWANPKGLDFYDRLVDGLLEAGIRPFGCLYHWDLPQALQERGGWHNRAMADWFAEYAMVVGARLGDRVKDWMMLNEPSVVALFGHGLGSHAPGLVGRESFFKAIHHQNLAQGAAMQALRGLSGDFRLGTVLNLQPAHGESERVEDQVAAEMWDAAWNRCCIDPLVKGTYPDIVAQDLEPLVKANDLNIIRQPVDILGVNYYSDMGPPGGYPTPSVSPIWGGRSIHRDCTINWSISATITAISPSSFPRMARLTTMW